MQYTEYKNHSCIALTMQGAALAARLAECLPGGADVYLPGSVFEQAAYMGAESETPKAEQSCSGGSTPGRGFALTGNERSFNSLSALMKEIFSLYRGHIFISASGIAVRSIAPLLRGKNVDPAVVICDQRGQFCISLLSGHFGGGNKLARRVAGIIGGTPVITTATDVEELPAPDLLAREAGCRILDWPEVKTVNAAILRGEKIAVYDPLRILACNGPQPRRKPAAPNLAGSFAENPAATNASYSCEENEPRKVLQPSPIVPPGPQPAVAAHWRHVPPRPGLLRLAVPALHVGVGCRLGASAQNIAEAVRKTLEEAGLELNSIAALASIEQKNGEPGLLEAARLLKAALNFFSPKRLAEMPVKNPSPKASELFDQPDLGVCEGAALASAWSAERPASLVVEKTRCDDVTVAVAVNMKFL